MSQGEVYAAAHNRRIGRSIFLLVAAGILALFIAGGFAVSTLAINEEATSWVEHSREVEVELAEVSTLVERSEAARRGYLIARDKRFRDTWSETSSLIPLRIVALRRLTADNQEQVVRLGALVALLRKQEGIAARSVAAVDSGDFAAAIAAFRTDRGAETVRQARALAATMAKEERVLLRNRAEARRTATRNFYAVLALCGLLVLLVIGACIAVIRRYTSEINDSRASLRTANADLETAVLGRTAELQRANDEIQRFAYIVSHDLRSPLVNVMGFTAELDSARAPLAGLLAAAEARAPDLVTPEARLAIEEDVPEAVRFIRSSTQKMDRLINAILKLSREGRRAIAPERIDMGQMLSDIVDAQKFRADELGAAITIDPSLPGLTSDRLSVEQIFSNLVDNALKYLSPARPGAIRISGRAAGGRIVYDVTDNGRGIEPRDHQRVFDLFRRSGEQNQPGEGIGLAHVRSLAWRLGGTIEVQSALDEGTTFRLSLPSNIGVEGINS